MKSFFLSVILFILAFQFGFSNVDTLAPTSTLDQQKFQQLMEVVIQAISGLEGFNQNKPLLITDRTQLDQLVYLIRTLYPEKSFSENARATMNSKGIWIWSGKPQGSDGGVLYQLGLPETEVIDSKAVMHEELLGKAIVRVYRRSLEVNQAIDQIEDLEITDFNLKSFFDVDQILDQVKTIHDPQVLDLWIRVLITQVSSLSKNSNYRKQILKKIETFLEEKEYQEAIQDKIKREFILFLIDDYVEQHQKNPNEASFQKLKEIADTALYTPFVRTLAAKEVYLDPNQIQYQAEPNLESEAGQILLKIATSNDYLIAVREKAFEIIFPQLKEIFEVDGKSRLQMMIHELLIKVMIDGSIRMDLRNQVFKLVKEGLLSAYQTAETIKSKRLIRRILTTILWEVGFDKNHRQDILNVFEEYEQNVWENPNFDAGQETLTVAQIQIDKNDYQFENQHLDDKKLEYASKQLETALRFVRYFGNISGYQFEIQVIRNNPQLIQYSFKDQKFQITLDESMMLSPQGYMKLALSILAGFESFAVGNDRLSFWNHLFVKVRKLSSDPFFKKNMSLTIPHPMNDALRQMALFLDAPIPSYEPVEKYLDAHGVQTTIEEWKDNFLFYSARMFFELGEGFLNSDLLTQAKQYFEMSIDPSQIQSLADIQAKVIDVDQYLGVVQNMMIQAMDRLGLLLDISKNRDTRGVVIQDIDLDLIQQLHQRYPQLSILSYTLAKIYFESGKSTALKKLIEISSQTDKGFIWSTIIKAWEKDKQLDQMLAQQDPSLGSMPTSPVFTGFRGVTQDVSARQIHSQATISVTEMRFREYFNALELSIKMQNQAYIDHMIDLLEMRLRALKNKKQISETLFYQIKYKAMKLTMQYAGYTNIKIDTLYMHQYYVNNNMLEEARQLANEFLDWHESNSVEIAQDSDYRLYYETIFKGREAQVEFQKQIQSGSLDANTKKQIQNSSLKPYADALKIYKNHQEKGLNLLLIFDFIYSSDLNNPHFLHAYLVEQREFELADYFIAHYQVWLKNFPADHISKPVPFHLILSFARKTYYQMKDADKEDQRTELKVAFLDALVKAVDEISQLAQSKIKNNRVSDQEKQQLMQWTQIMANHANNIGQFWSNLGNDLDQSLLLEFLQQLTQKYRTNRNPRELKIVVNIFTNLLIHSDQREMHDFPFSVDFLKKAVVLFDQMVNRYQAVGDAVYDPSLEAIEGEYGELDVYKAHVYRRIAQISQDPIEKLDFLSRAIKIYERRVQFDFYLKMPPKRGVQPSRTQNKYYYQPQFTDLIQESLKQAKALKDEYEKAAEQAKRQAIIDQVATGASVDPAIREEILAPLNQVNPKNGSNITSKLVGSVKALNLYREQWQNLAPIWEMELVQSMAEKVIEYFIKVEPKFRINFSKSWVILVLEDPITLVRLIQNQNESNQWMVIDAIFSQTKNLSTQMKSAKNRTDENQINLKQLISFLLKFESFHQQPQVIQFFDALITQEWLPYDLKQKIQNRNEAQKQALIQEQVDIYKQRMPAIYLTDLEIQTVIQDENIDPTQVLPLLEQKEVEKYQHHYPLATEKVEEILKQARELKKSKGQLDNLMNNVQKLKEELVGYITYLTDQEVWQTVFLKEDGLIDDELLSGKTNQLPKQFRLAGVASKLDVAKERIVAAEVLKIKQMNLFDEEVFETIDWKNLLNQARSKHLSWLQFYVLEIQKIFYQQLGEKAYLPEKQIQALLSTVLTSIDISMDVSRLSIDWKNAEIAYLKQLFPAATELDLIEVISDDYNQRISMADLLKIGIQKFSNSMFASDLNADELVQKLSNIRPENNQEMFQLIKAGDIAQLQDRYPQIDEAVIRAKYQEFWEQGKNSSQVYEALQKIQIKEKFVVLIRQSLDGDSIFQRYFGEQVNNKVDDILNFIFTTFNLADFVGDKAYPDSDWKGLIQYLWEEELMDSLIESHQIHLPKGVLRNEIISASIDGDASNIVQHFKSLTMLISDQLSLEYEEDKPVFKIHWEGDFKTIEDYLNSDIGRKRIYGILKDAIQRQKLGDIIIETEDQSENSAQLLALIKTFNDQYSSVHISYDEEKRSLQFDVVSTMTGQELEQLFSSPDWLQIINQAAELHLKHYYYSVSEESMKEDVVARLNQSIQEAQKTLKQRQGQFENIFDWVMQRIVVLANEIQEELGLEPRYQTNYYFEESLIKEHSSNIYHLLNDVLLAPEKFKLSQSDIEIILMNATDKAHDESQFDYESLGAISGLWIGQLKEGKWSALMETVLKAAIRNKPENSDERESSTVQFKRTLEILQTLYNAILQSSQLEGSDLSDPSEGLLLSA